MPCFRKHSAPGPTSCDPNSPSRWHQVGGLPQFFKFSVILSALALALLPLCSWDPGQCLLTSAGELGTWDVSPLHSHMPTGTCTGLCCPPFPHALWDLLIPFHTHYYFFFPKPKALLLHSFTLTAYSCQASHFITLQSSHLNHSEPHALSLARPFSSPVNTFLYFFSSNSSLMSHSGLVLFSFCLHFSSLLFISPCPSAYPPCAPYHPPHIRFSLTASIFSFPQELSPSLFTCSSSANEQCSALLFSPRNTHTHRNIY